MKRRASNARRFPSMHFYTYILLCADETLYVGSTNNLTRRVHAHNHAKSGAHYTKIRRPVALVYHEIFPTFREARQREYAIKQYSRNQKFQLIKMRKVHNSSRTGDGGRDIVFL